MAVELGCDNINRMGARIFSLWLVVVVGIFAAGIFGPFQRADAGTAENIDGWAWSANIGWISFNSANDHDPATPGRQTASINYGVTADATGNLSGYAWSPNIGWINFNRVSGCPATTANPDCAPVINKSSWQLRGWAQACAGRLGASTCTGPDRTDGWDGWISLFGGVTHAVKITGCNYSGFAWGGPVVGWISFNSANDHNEAIPGIQPAANAYGVLGTGSACEDSSPIFECNDGIDNDHDGACDFSGCQIAGVDRPADAGCFSEIDNSENQIPVIIRIGPGTLSLNVGDAFTDPGVAATDSEDGDLSVNVVVSGAGVNTSLPGTYIIIYNVTDSAGAAALPVSRTVVVGVPFGPECRNGFDDDGDGGCDYGGCHIGGVDLPPDLGCASADSLIEDPECSNGLDDDSDGLTDGADPGCWSDPADSSTYDPTRNRERRIRIIEVLPE